MSRAYEGCFLAMVIAHRLRANHDGAAPGKCQESRIGSIRSLRNDASMLVMSV